MRDGVGQEVLIRLFVPGDGQAFRDLNMAWLTAFFHVEAKDEATLSDPKGTIRAPGGQILLADIAGRTAGCVALLAMEDGAYEVAKMAVAPEAHGVGRRLLEAAIAWARERNARRLYLESNARLAPALRLYESAGFRHLSPQVRPVSSYARADVFMEMSLEDKAP
jgi:putative acetyltransferase